MRFENHPPDELLQSHVDRTLDVEETATIAAHLDECQRCARRVRELALLDRVARGLPLQRADDGLTRSVMRRISLDPASGRLFRLLLYAPPVLGLCMVVSIMVGAFFMTGVLEPDDASPVTQSIVDAARVFGTWADKGGNYVSEKLGGLVSFSFGERTLFLVAATCLIFLLVTVFDRMVGRKLLHRVR